MLRISKAFKLLILIVIFILPITAYTAPASNVLVIHSYHAGFFWTAAIESGIIQAFESSKTEHNLIFEYLDAKRIPPRQFAPGFAAYLNNKYSDLDFDVIIVSDDAAFRFVLDYHNELFPETPVVFCGVNDFDSYTRQLPAKITGIAEDFDLSQNFELIERLHGLGTTVAVVADSTVSGSENTRLLLDRINDPNGPDLNYEILFGYETAELEYRLGRLPKNAVILNLGFWQDKNRKFLSCRESINLLTRTGLPVYTAWDQAVRFGTVGGIVLDVKNQGHTAAVMALRILSGENAERIPVQRNPRIHPVFDHQALKKHNISIVKLPADSSILNRPDSIYFQYPLTIASISTIIVFLIGLVVLLGSNIAKRKQAESLFSSLFNSAPDVILLFNTAGKILIANKAVENFYGYSMHEIKKMTIQELDTPEYARDFDKRVEEILTRETKIYEVHHLSKVGRILEFESRVATVMYHGKPAILSLLRNINEWNRNQHVLEESLSRNELLLREIHHRVKNNLQIIISLLRLETDKTQDQASISILDDSRQRINAIAAVHELLYQSENLYSIYASEYLKPLVHQLASAHRGSGEIDFTLNIEELKLHLDEAIPVGIIITELVTNSIKYGTVNGECHFRLAVSLDKSSCLLEYEDQGPGYDFNTKDQDTLGLLLVENLSLQLNGQLQHDGKSGFILRFPLREHEDSANS